MKRAIEGLPTGWQRAMSTKNGTSVAVQRKYSVLDVKAAKQIASMWLRQARLENAADFGLPEIDDRYHIWRVPLLKKESRERIGEVVPARPIDSHGLIDALPGCFFVRLVWGELLSD